MRFSDFVIINPKMKLKRNSEYSYVDMEAIEPKIRYVRPSKAKKFKGGGSKFQSGDVLFARITPCLENGKIAQVVELEQEMGFGSTEFFVFRAKEEISTSSYIYYLTLTREVRDIAEKSMTGASGRQRANIEAIKNIEVYTPSINVQNKITNILTSLDDLIDINLKRIKLQENIILKIYHKFFSQFKTSDSKTFNNSNNWKKIKIKNLLKKISPKKKIKKNEYLEEGSHPIIDQSKKFIAGYTNDLEAIYETEEPLIVFGDHTRVIKFVDFPFARGADGTQIICSNNKSIDNIFLYYLLLNTNISNEYYARHFKYLKMKEVYIPPQHLIEKFIEAAKPIRKNISNLIKTNEYIVKIKNLLLPKLLSGELEI
jgi:type I restriction enzyme, S subunit